MNLDELHQQSLIIDGLVFYSDGDVTELKQGNINAANVTVSHFEGDYEQSCEQIAHWLSELAKENTPWHLIENTNDLDVAQRKNKIGLIMGWQNMRAIGDNLDRLAFFKKLGIRIMQLTYNRRNFLGDGCLEKNDGGLSGLGRQAVAKMNDLGIAIDLSHVGDITALQAAEHSQQPVLITHANAKAVVDVPRNRTDDLIKAVAQGGGLIGTSVYGTMCWDGNQQRRPQLTDYIEQLEYICNLVGLEHVAIGTDLPVVSDLEKVKAITEMTLKRFPEAIGDYAQAFGNDIRDRYVEGVTRHSELINISTALRERGWKDSELKALLGENFKRVLGEIWH